MITYLSKSQLGDYMSCPHHYYRARIKKDAPSNPTDITGLIRGIVVHEMAENYINGNPFADLEYYFYSEVWKQSRAGKLALHAPEDFDVDSMKVLFGETEFDYKEELQEVLEKLPKYWALLKAELRKLVPYQVMAEENKTCIFEVGDERVEFTGFFDLTALINGVPYIVDYKTSAKGWTEKDIYDKTDVYLYAALWRKLTGVIPVIRLINCVSLKTKDYAQTFDVYPTPEELDTWEGLVIYAKSDIENGRFPKNSLSWKCNPKYCEYFASCQSSKARIVNLSPEKEEKAAKT